MGPWVMQRLLLKNKLQNNKIKALKKVTMRVKLKVMKIVNTKIREETTGTKGTIIETETTIDKIETTIIARVKIVRDKVVQDEIIDSTVKAVAKVIHITGGEVANASSVLNLSQSITIPTIACTIVMTLTFSLM